MRVIDSRGAGHRSALVIGGTTLRTTSLRAAGWYSRGSGASVVCLLEIYRGKRVECHNWCFSHHYALGTANCHRFVAGTESDYSKSRPVGNYLPPFRADIGVVSGERIAVCWCLTLPHKLGLIWLRLEVGEVFLLNSCEGRSVKACFWLGE